MGDNNKQYLKEVISTFTDSKRNFKSDIENGKQFSTKAQIIIE